MLPANAQPAAQPPHRSGSAGSPFSPGVPLEGHQRILPADDRAGETVERLGGIATLPSAVGRRRLVPSTFRGQAGEMGEGEVSGDCRAPGVRQSVASVGDVAKGIGTPSQAAALLALGDVAKWIGRTLVVPQDVLVYKLRVLV